MGGHLESRLLTHSAFALLSALTLAVAGERSHRGYPMGARPPGPGDRFYPSPERIDSARLVVPGDFRYQGAFRLPRDNGGSEHGFTYLVGAMAYHPKGDPSGGKDGYPGSLLMGGHVKDDMVAEIGIPAPVKSKDWRKLPEAKLLRPFRELAVHPGHSGITVMAVAYLPGGEAGQPDRLHATLADGYLPKEGMKTHVSAAMDFTGRTQPKAFHPDKVHCYSDYLFPIPKSWADRYAPGMRLAGGRHREGDLCGEGPALFVMNPDADSLLPYVGTRPILRYLQKGGALNSYSHGGDVYHDAAWIETGKKSAVLFAGKKGLGEPIYGTFCKVQGFHDLKGYLPYIILYDPEELGRVALGHLPAHAPQPYAAFDVNDLMFFPNTEPCHRTHLSALAFDSARGLLYATERGKGEMPAVHVWKLR